MTTDPLASWNDGPAKRAIVDFVNRRTSEGSAGNGRRLILLVRRTDEEREYAYDAPHFGMLKKALDEAASRGWVVVDMKTNWNTVFPPATQ